MTEVTGVLGFFIKTIKDTAKQVFETKLDLYEEAHGVLQEIKKMGLKMSLLTAGDITV